MKKLFSSFLVLAFLLVSIAPASANRRGPNFTDEALQIYSDSVETYCPENGPLSREEFKVVGKDVFVNYPTNLDVQGILMFYNNFFRIIPVYFWGSVLDQKWYAFTPDFGAPLETSYVYQEATSPDFSTGWEVLVQSGPDKHIVILLDYRRPSQGLISYFKGKAVVCAEKSVLNSAVRGWIARWRL